MKKAVLALAAALESLALRLTSLVLDGQPAHQLPCRDLYCPCCEVGREQGRY